MAAEDAIAFGKLLQPGLGESGRTQVNHIYAARALARFPQLQVSIGENPAAAMRQMGSAALVEMGRLLHAGFAPDDVLAAAKNLAQLPIKEQARHLREARLGRSSLGQGLGNVWYETDGDGSLLRITRLVGRGRRTAPTK